MTYYDKIFELVDILDYKSLFHLISPEISTRFHAHYPLTRMIIYSPRAIKRIKMLVRGKTAMLVPGRPSNDDILISDMLKLPIMSGDPQKNFLHSTKSGAKKIFTECDIPIPPGSFDIYDEKEFILTLTKLIAYNLDVSKWVFKIDDEHGSRGIASLSVDNIRPLVALRKRVVEITEDIILQIHEILTNVIPRKTKITSPNLYRSFSEFMRYFTMKGGIIEAVPAT